MSQLYQGQVDVLMQLTHQQRMIFYVFHLVFKGVEHWLYDDGVFVIGVYGIQGVPRSIGILQPMLLFFAIMSYRLSVKYILTSNFSFKKITKKLFYLSSPHAFISIRTCEY